MIQNSGKNNSKHERLELSSKGRKSGERAKREGKGVPNSRRTTGEGSFTPSLLSCCRPSLTISIEIQANRGIDDHLGDQELLGWLTLKSLRSIKWCAHEDDFLITFDGGLAPNLKAHSSWIPSIPRTYATCWCASHFSRPLSFNQIMLEFTEFETIYVAVIRRFRKTKNLIFNQLEKLKIICTVA